jgi:AcrR family transcriptional regulator
MRVRDEVKEAAIRKKAMDLIVHEGFDGLSMHKLAKAASVSVATIYIYYKDREDLILSLCKEGMERMTEATMKNFDPSMPFAEGLRVQWKNRASFWMKNPIESQFMERMRHSPYHDKFVKYLKKEFTDVMYQFVNTAIKNKELIALPIEVYWSVAYAPLYQLVKFHMDGAKFPGLDRVKLTDENMEQTLQLVVKALRP